MKIFNLFFPFFRFSNFNSRFGFHWSSGNIYGTVEFKYQGLILGWVKNERKLILSNSSNFQKQPERVHLLTRFVRDVWPGALVFPFFRKRRTKWLGAGDFALRSAKNPRDHAGVAAPRTKDHLGHRRPKNEPHSRSLSLFSPAMHSPVLVLSKPLSIPRPLPLLILSVSSRSSFASSKARVFDMDASWEIELWCLVLDD